jgi:hypothetical protein
MHKARDGERQDVLGRDTPWLVYPQAGGVV